MESVLSSRPTRGGQLVTVSAVVPTVQQRSSFLSAVGLGLAKAGELREGRSFREENSLVGGA